MHVRTAPRVCLLLAGILAAGGTGCGSRGPRDVDVAPGAPRPLTCISFAIEDPPEAPATVDAATRAFRSAARALAEAGPDILILDYRFPSLPMEDMLAVLGEEGLDFGHREILGGGDPPAGALLLLSRPPIVARRSQEAPEYRIAERVHHLEPGVLDVDLFDPAHGLVRIAAARLKDKVFHVSGQTEMRRSEARMVGRILRHGGRQQETDSLVAAVTAYDTPDTAPVREIMEATETPLLLASPLDGNGDAWTMRDASAHLYERTDHIFLSPAMRDAVEKGCEEILDQPALRAVSRHRALCIRFGGCSAKTTAASPEYGAGPR